jgi:hypothetical protein
MSATYRTHIRATQLDSARIDQEGFNFNGMVIRVLHHRGRSVSSSQSCFRLANKVICMPGRLCKQK